MLSNSGSSMLSRIPLVLRSALYRIKASPLGYRLARGAFWSLVGAVIGRGLGLVSSVIVARILGKTGFGELGIIQSTVGMFGTFAGFGLGMTATKFISEYRSTDPGRAGRIRGLSSAVAWITSGLTSTIFFFMVPWLAERTLAAPHLAGLLQISSIFLFLTSINGAQTGALSGFEAFKTAAKISLFSGLANLPLMVGGVYVAGITGAVWGMIIATWLNWLLNHLAIRHECAKQGVPYSYKGCWKEHPAIWKFSLPSVLGAAMVGPVMWATNAFLVNQPNGYAELGVYNAAMRVKQVPEMILGLLMTPFLPILSEQFAKGAVDDYKRTVRYAFGISMLIIVPVSVMQIAVPSLTLLPFGKSFSGNEFLVQWIMLHAVLIGLFQPIGSIIASMNRMWFGWGYNLLWGISVLILSYLFIPKYGATGLAAATAITYWVTGLLSVIYIRRFEKSFIIGVPVFKSVCVVFGVMSLVFVSVSCSAIRGFAALPILIGVASGSLLVRWAYRIVKIQSPE